MRFEATAQQAEQAASDYLSKKTKLDKSKDRSAIEGFIKRNRIVGKTTEEIDALIQSAEKLGNGVLLGEGDKFKRWCESNGREVPPDNLVELMNRDPFEGGIHVKAAVGENPSLWRSWSSYRAGKGRRNV